MNRLLSIQTKDSMNTLKNRFETNMHRHIGLSWDKVEEKLRMYPDKLSVVLAMENTGGEPDVIYTTKMNNNFVFIDCSKETPENRRSTCYDNEALDKRKENKPKNSAIGMAEEIGITLLNEEQYRNLQNIESFDTKTSSWIKTPGDIRSLGGALFADYRYNNVFVYHNGAESYYSGRGFRGYIEL